MQKLKPAKSSKPKPDAEKKRGLSVAAKSTSQQFSLVLKFCSREKRNLKCIFPKRYAPLAVVRNRMRRVVKEIFRRALNQNYSLTVRLLSSVKKNNLENSLLSLKSELVKCEFF